MTPETRRRRRKTLLYWLMLSPLLLINLFPFAVMLSTALKSSEEIFANPVRWIPAAPRWENFAHSWTATNFGGALVNSLVVAFASVALTILLGVLSAYATFRFEFRGRGAWRLTLLMTQMVSPILLVLGLFRFFVWLGLVDSLTPLIATYAVFNLAFAALMLENYFRTIPRDIEEAAWIDGASRFRAMTRIFLPLAAPAVAVAATFTFVQVWNEFIIALTLLRSAENYTLPISIYAQASSRYVVQWNYVMASILMATVPMTLIFAWLQKYLVQGMSSGGVK